MEGMNSFDLERGDFMNEETKRFLELLRKLNFNQTKEFFYMVKGAVIVANEPQKRGV